MTGGGQFRVYPWPDLDSFEQVTSILIAVNFDQIPSFDAVRLSRLVWCRDQLIVWKSKFHSQHYHELNASFALLTAIVAEARYHIVRRRTQQDSTRSVQVGPHDDEDDDGGMMMVGEKGQEEEDVRQLAEQWKVVSSTSQQELCSLYATALMEFFKMLAYYEVKSNGQVSKTSFRSDASVVRIAERIKIPQYIVEYRHRIAHSQLPNFRHLKQACGIALNWLNENYWARVSMAQQTGQETLSDTLNKMQRLFTQLTSSKRLNSNQKIKSRRKELPSGVRMFSESELGEMRTRMQRLLNVGGQFCVQLIARRLVEDTLNEFVDLKVGTLKDSVKKEFEILDQLKNSQPEQPETNEKKSKYFVKAAIHPALQAPCPFNLMSETLFDRYAPVFQCLLKLDQPQWLPLLMSSLIDMFDDDQDLDIAKTAKLWFSQLQLSILYSFIVRDLYSKQKPNSQAHYEKIRQVINSSSSMFRLCSPQQQNELRWLHLFHQLISSPSVNHLNWVLARNFFPLIKSFLTAEKFEQTIQLLAIYVAADKEVSGSRKAAGQKENGGQGWTVETLNEQIRRCRTKMDDSKVPIADRDWRGIPVGINDFNVEEN